MKKVLFFFALMGCLIGASAQDVFFINDNAEFGQGDTIDVFFTEEYAADYDYEVLVFLQIKNDGEAFNATLTTNMVSGAGFEVKSVCSTTCQVGNTSPAFDIPSHATTDFNVYPEYTLDPHHMTAEGVGVAELVLNNTADNSVAVRSLLRMTYENPLAINGASKINVKVFPNPTTSVLNITSEEADEIILTDLSGKIVLRQRVNGNAQISVESLSNGTYVLNTLSNGRVNGAKKVVVR